MLAFNSIALQLSLPCYRKELEGTTSFHYFMLISSIQPTTIYTYMG